MKNLVLAVALLAGCGSNWEPCPDLAMPPTPPPTLNCPGCNKVPPKLVRCPGCSTVEVPPDLAMPPDLSTPPDMATPPDLSSPPDLREPCPDLAKPPRGDDHCDHTCGGEHHSCHHHSYQ